MVLSLVTLLSLVLLVRLCGSDGNPHRDLALECLALGASLSVEPSVARSNIMNHNQLQYILILTQPLLNDPLDFVVTRTKAHTKHCDTNNVNLSEISMFQQPLRC